MGYKDDEINDFSYDLALENDKSSNSWFWKKYKRKIENINL